MQVLLLSASSSGWIVIIWIAVALISMITSARNKRAVQPKPKPQQFPNGEEPAPFYGPDHSSPNRTFSDFTQNSSQWDAQKIREQTERYAENNRMTEQEYMREEEFRTQQYTFRQEVPKEVVHEYVEEYFEEYVPEEFGESGSDRGNDRFYKSAEIQNALRDEQDLAREKAYRRKTEDAFRPGNKQPDKKEKLFAQPNSLKKAILLSEILGEPKSLR